MATTNRGVNDAVSFTPSPLDLRPMTADSSGHLSPSSIDIPSPRSNNGPLPLPSFVFPAKPSSSAPSSYSRASGRRPVSAIEVKGGLDKLSGERDALRTPELPAFSFGSSSTSPPTSPRSRNIPSRPGSHQRSTSEFIGGDGLPGSRNAPMSSSPTKGDGALPRPPGFGPPAGRRGHKHVRSAAISHADISKILLPPTSPTIIRGTSAPCSPAVDRDLQDSPFPGSFDPSKPQTVSEPTSGDIESPKEPLRALSRARVGFSDALEFIPRPLSVVSSDSASTVRQGHSVSNSISSVISTGASSPLSKEKRGIPQSTRNPTDTRPRTAEPVLDHDRTQHHGEPKRRNSIPLLMEAAAASVSAPSTPRSVKKWTFFGHETNSGDSSPKSPPTSAEPAGKEANTPAEEFHDEPELTAADEPLPSIEPTSSRRSSISRKPSKKQKRVRTWAGSILGRKSRQRSQKPKLSRRSPTPPHRSYPPVDEISRDPFTYPSETQALRVETDNSISSWKPRKLPPQEDDSMSPMIDLDAALGPFNTPSGFGDDWEISQKTGPKKRAMHSAAGLGGFTGPGMHYHRRAESAPEFENPRPRFGLHRLGSSSTMAMEDVSEEDEDDWEDAKPSSDKEDASTAGDDEIKTGLGIDIKVEDAEDQESDREIDSALNRGVKRKGSSLSEGDRRTVGTAKSEHSATSLYDEPIMEEPAKPIEIVDDSTSSRPDSRAHSSDSTATPPFRPRSGKELAPVDIQPFSQPFSLQPNYLTPTSPRSTTQSSFPSPRSPFSYDAQRISTAPSSVTDEHGFQSLLLGEPGPELRHSVDEAPSLTSSNSTTTRESGHPSAGNPQFRDGQRSASLSSAAISRKRSSMASLSRLISSSHGEKSKLSIESRAPAATETEKKEKSKSKRISRLMQFWKPNKEATA
ncbi:hypothetical protein GLAREA_01842 [Glarea lozoyensis ATCC 20868]|uniref:Cell wall proline rich protein n=1 Tax=Glarea lozoyensis (strain ATCC 20868 / MF5171) TaxID=1116229 RepID=S3CJF9_GLAL2|nr:uncharacterized protein GLAREA_01842 [Glarea lozoyensis ATCC 20868]EPE25930.1 hypothetical protein GLAREA_01842 [Glarea lozoyensis ATCC 20868]